MPANSARSRVRAASRRKLSGSTNNGPSPKICGAPHSSLVARPRPATFESVLHFSRVSYRVNGREILRDLSFEVDQGQTLVLLGRSGSGKTTALKMVNALLTPSSGEVSVEGRATIEWNPIELRRRIGYV